MARLNARWDNFLRRGLKWDHFWQDAVTPVTSAPSPTPSGRLGVIPAQPGSTRFYFGTSEPNTIVPAAYALWTDASSVLRRAFSVDTSRNDGFVFNTRIGNGVNSNNRLLYQYHSPPLAAQTVDGLATFYAQFLANEDALATNARAQIAVYIADATGALKYAMYNGDPSPLSNEFVLTTPTNRTFPRFGPITFDVTGDIGAGDFLVVEIGATIHSTDAVNGFTLRRGTSSAAGDLPNNETSTSLTLNPFFEIAPGLVLLSQVTGAPAGAEISRPSTRVSGAATPAGAQVLKTTIEPRGTQTPHGADVLKTTIEPRGAVTLAGADRLTPVAQERGSETPHGADVLKATLEPRGAATPQGADVFKATVEPRGAVTPAGADALKATIEPRGASTPAGADRLTPVSQARGAETPTGAQTLKATIEPRGAETPTGADVIKVTVEPRGAATPAGADVFKTTVEPRGSATPAGVDRLTAAVRESGGETPAGAVSESSVQHLAATGTETPTGADSLKPVAHEAGSAAPTSSVGKVVYLVLGGSVASSGSEAVVVTKSAAGAASPAGVDHLAVDRSLSGSAASSGAETLRATAVKGGSVTPHGSRVRSVLHHLAAALVPAGLARLLASLRSSSSTASSGDLDAELAATTLVLGGTVSPNSGLHVRVTSHLAGDVDPHGSLPDLDSASTPTQPQGLGGGYAYTLPITLRDSGTLYLSGGASSHGEVYLIHIPGPTPAQRFYERNRAVLLSEIDPDLSEVA